MMVWLLRATIATSLLGVFPAWAKLKPWKPSLDDWMVMPAATKQALVDVVEANGGAAPAWATAIPATGNFTAAFQVVLAVPCNCPL
jgi:hypothetical protein